MTVTIKKDLHMTQQDVANSNIVALLATYVKPHPIHLARRHLTILGYSSDSFVGPSVIALDHD